MFFYSLNNQPLQFFSKRYHQNRYNFYLNFRPYVNSNLISILDYIGVPKVNIFIPDKFQVRALEALVNFDVIVSAPTGSGKTWIAEQAIKRILDFGQRVWYATPLKALSNSKYVEFSKLFNSKRVGILTGDRKENIQAQLIIGTTEILRNQLYDAMYRGNDVNSSLVVLDEAHFLGDPERGVVWEEIIIYLPIRIRLLLLSATVKNVDQISRWISYVRGEPCVTIYNNQRSVPLYPLFLFPDGELAPLISFNKLYPKVHYFLEIINQSYFKGFIQTLPSFDSIMKLLETTDLLPAIFFLKSRADCDKVLYYISDNICFRESYEKRQHLDRIINSFLYRYPFLSIHPQMKILRTLRIAAHHAGHLPQWRLLIEELMQQGLINALFSTSTVAAGVNFPARTVVITQSDRYNGYEFVDLLAIDLLQMVGRAGRRGMDKIGFCLVVPGPFNNIKLVTNFFLKTKIEPIVSQLAINFSMVLNLLLSYRPNEIKKLLKQSLYTFQYLEKIEGEGEGEDKIIHRYDSNFLDFFKTFGEKIKKSACFSIEQAIVRRKRWRQLNFLLRNFLFSYDISTYGYSIFNILIRGRMFMDIFGFLNIVFKYNYNSKTKDSRLLAISFNSEYNLRNFRLQLRVVSLNEIVGVFQEVFNLPDTNEKKVLAKVVLDQLSDYPTPLTMLKLNRFSQNKVINMYSDLISVNSELDRMPCSKCILISICQDTRQEINGMFSHFEKIMTNIQGGEIYFWYNFIRYLEFLRSENFVDNIGFLTYDGVWASNLRLSSPILIAEAIRKKVLPDYDPILLAALVALFVDNRQKGNDFLYFSQRLANSLKKLQRALNPILERLDQWKFMIPIMSFSAASAIFAWGIGLEFNEVSVLYGAGEGDLVNLIFRTVDNLRQITNLYITHPRLSACAKEAVNLLLKEPIILFN